MKYAAIEFTGHATLTETSQYLAHYAAIMKCSSVDDSSSLAGKYYAGVTLMREKTVGASKNLGFV